MEPQTTDAATSRGDAGRDRAGDQTPPAVDLARLADKVYRLLREELRLERVRGGVGPSRGRS
jgi:hypothetical protein